MQEMQVQSLGQHNPLEEEMATHSSILAWEIPWTEEPGPAPHGMTKESDTTWRLNNTHLTSKLHSEALQLGLKHMTLSGVRTVVVGGIQFSPEHVYTLPCVTETVSGKPL